MDVMQSFFRELRGNQGLTRFIESCYNKIYEKIDRFRHETFESEQIWYKEYNYGQIKKHIGRTA